MIRRSRRIRAATVATASASAFAALFGTGCGGGRPLSTGAQGVKLVLEHSGLLANYPLDRPLPLSGAFRLGGTAPRAEATAKLLADGLHVGVGAPQTQSWRGFFAATSATYPAGSVFHVRIWRSTPARVSASQSGIALLAIQTADSPALDYVLVASMIARRSPYWAVGYATGDRVYSRTKILWIRQSVSRDAAVTLRTDGHSRYAVYLGRRRVYASRTLKMSVNPPFRVYLEVEARRLPFQARFQDLWIAADNTVTVDGLRPDERVSLTPGGNPAIRALANAAGQAELVLPLDEAMGTGTLALAGAGRSNRFAGVKFAGGDVYRVLRG